jgi:hypothetical protein
MRRRPADDKFGAILLNFLFAIDNPPQKGYHLTVFTVACAKSP